jgi:hypothetical protein
VPTVPGFGQPCGEDFRKLVKYRNGLVHAGASRPETAGLPDDERPMPPRGDMNTMPAGWPVRVVLELVRRTDQAAGMTPPSWLVDP